MQTYSIGLCKIEASLVKFVGSPTAQTYCQLTLFYPVGGGVKYAPLRFFLHHPKTAQGIKLKLSDFKDTLLRHILQVKPVHYVSSCCQCNKITEGTSQDLAPQKSEKSAICRDIELKFGIVTNVGPLS